MLEFLFGGVINRLSCGEVESLPFVRTATGKSEIKILVSMYSSVLKRLRRAGLKDTLVNR